MTETEKGVEELCQEEATNWARKRGRAIILEKGSNSCPPTSDSGSELWSLHAAWDTVEE